MNRIALAAVVLLSTASLAQAQSYDETRCRSAQSQNQAPAWGQGTATGFASDLIVIKNCNGQIVDCHTVGWWCAQPQGSTQRLSGVTNHSGGQTSIRFNFNVFTAANPLVQGGTYEILRNNVLIDRDRLY